MADSVALEVVMKKIVALILVMCALVGGCFYVYKMKIEKHYLISATEKTLRGMMKSPSSFKVVEVSFYVMPKTTPKMVVEFESKNSYGTPIAGIATFIFARGRWDSGIKADTALYKMREELHERLKNEISSGAKILTPFENMEIVSASIDGQKMDDVSVLLLQSNIMTEKRDYSGPTLGGKIDKINDDGTVECSFDTKKYIPGEIFPYK